MTTHPVAKDVTVIVPTLGGAVMQGRPRENLAYRSRQRCGPRCEEALFGHVISPG